MLQDLDKRFKRLMITLLLDIQAYRIKISW